MLTLPLLATIAAHNVLDLGTGTGRYAIKLAAQGANVVAVDQSTAMLAVAKQAARQAGVQIGFRQHRLNQALTELPESFDLVLSALVLCHVADLNLVAQEAYRVLTPGGHFLVTDFHPTVIAAGWRTQFVNDDGAFLLPTAQHTVDDYLNALRTAGFQIEQVQEGRVRDVPANAFPAELVAQDGDKPFCLVILATKS